MEKIIFIFFTFLGNLPAFAQSPGEMLLADSLRKGKPDLALPVRNDSLPQKEKPTMKLFPNPASNKVEIEIKGFEPGFIEVQLINNNGTLVRDDKRLLFSGNEIIVVMFSLQPGLYLLLLKQKEKICKRKLIIR